MICIVDYGLGNVQAFSNVYRRLNIDARTAVSARELEGADKVVLAGVGAFDHAMARLEQSGMRAVLDDLVLGRKVPVLGVCVGMQILGHRSDEGTRRGLGWIDGSVKRLEANEEENLCLPHMGWNDVKPASGNGLFASLEENAKFYFLHTYYFQCDDQRDVAAMTSYGSTFASAICRDNVFGVQFHPEKSHSCGVRLLRNFAEM